MSKERKGNGPMKITMLRTELGQDETADGIALAQQRYLKGETYVVGQSLGRAFVTMGAAKEGAGSRAAETAPPVEGGAKEGAPENKAKKGAPKTKEK